MTYVFHCRAGIYGFSQCCPPAGAELRFEETPGIDAYQAMLRLLPTDLASWVRNDGIEPSAPFTVFCNDQPNQYWPDVKNPTNGCVRNIGAAKEGECVCLPMGILAGGVPLRARRPLEVQARHPLTGAVVTNLNLKAGTAFVLPQGPGAYILKCRF